MLIESLCQICDYSLRLDHVLILHLPLCFPLVDGAWNEWSGWSACSTSCSNGTMKRTRECNGPSYGGSECRGDWLETTNCFLKDCPGKIVSQVNKARTHSVKILLTFRQHLHYHSTGSVVNEYEYEYDEVRGHILHCVSSPLQWTDAGCRGAHGAAAVRPVGGGTSRDRGCVKGPSSVGSLALETKGSLGVATRKDAQVSDSPNMDDSFAM